MSTDLMSRDLLAGRTGGVLDYLSASRLNLWLRCPLAFRLKYIDAIPTPTSPAAFVGKAVHLGLECFYRHRQLGITLSHVDVAGRVVDQWDRAMAHENVSFAKVAEEQACQRQVLTLVQAYLQQVPIDEPRPLAVEVAAEAPLIDPVSGENLKIPLVGVMDLILPDTDGPIIADFKTTSRSGEPLEIVHEIQLSCYAYLFRHVSPVREGGLQIRNLVKTKVPQVRFHHYASRNEKHFNRLFAVIRAYLDDLDSGKYLFRPGVGLRDVRLPRPLCQTCLSSAGFRFLQAFLPVSAPNPPGFVGTGGDARVLRQGRSLAVPECTERQLQTNMRWGGERQWAHDGS